MLPKSDQLQIWIFFRVKGFNTVAVLFLRLPERTGAGFLWRAAEGGGSEGGNGQTEEEAPSGPAGPGEPLPACYLFPGRAHRTGGRRTDWLRGNCQCSQHILQTVLAEMPWCIDGFCSMAHYCHQLSIYGIARCHMNVFHLIDMARLQDKQQFYLPTHQAIWHTRLASDYEKCLKTLKRKSTLPLVAFSNTVDFTVSSTV